MAAFPLLRLLLAGLVASPFVSVSASNRLQKTPLGSHDHGSTCSAAPFLADASLCRPRGELTGDMPAAAAPGRLWEVRMTADKGRGLFAVVDIPQGTQLLTEDPLVVVQPPPMVPGRGFELAAMLPPVQAAFDGLTPSQQQRYLSCHEVRFGNEGVDEEEDDVSGGRLLRILRSNAYTTQDGRVAMYPDVALINHDCQPNVLNTDRKGGGSSDGDRHQRVIVATRDIAAGEEIVTTYVPLLADTATRAARLAQYGFTCTCRACRSTATSTLTADNDDAQRVAMKRVLDDVKQAAQHHTKTAARAHVDRAVALAAYIRAQGFADYGAQTSRLAAELASRAGQLATAAKWAAIHLEDVQLASVRGGGGSGDSVEARQARALIRRIERKMK